MYALPHRTLLVVCIVLLTLQGVGLRAAGPPSLDRHGDSLPTGAVARMGTARFRHGAPITFVRFIAKDREVVTLSLDESVRVWDARTGRLLRQFGRPRRLGYTTDMLLNGGVAGYSVYGSQTSVALSPDGRTLATGHNDGQVYLWDLASGREVRRFTPQPRNPITALAFTPDGKGLLTNGWNRIPRAWDLTGAKQVRQFGQERPLGFGTGLTFSPNGKLLATVETEPSKGQSTIRLWDAETAKELREIRGPDRDYTLRRVAFTPDSKTLVWSAGPGGKTMGVIHLYDVNSGKAIGQRGKPADKGPNSMALVFSPDGRLLARKYTCHPTIQLWEFKSGKELPPLDERPFLWSGLGGAAFLCGAESLADVAFSSDGKLLAAPLANALRTWDVAKGLVVREAAGHEGVVSALAVSPSGDILTTWGQDETVRQWEAATGRELRRFRLPPGSSRPVFTSDGKHFAFAASDDTVRLWDTASAKELAVIKVPDRGFVQYVLKRLGSLALSLDGKVLATKSYDSEVRLWDVNTGKALGKVMPPANSSGRLPIVYYQGYDSAVAPGVSLSPNGDTLLCVVGLDRTREVPPDTMICLWDVRRERLLRRFEVRQRGVAACVFSPDGRSVASANTDHTISLWESATGQERRTFKAEALCLAFSPDGRRLAAGCGDRVLRVWELPSGELIGQFPGHTADITAIAFAPGGERIFTSSWDTTALAWNLAATASPPKKVGAPFANEGKSLWDDLASDNARRAYIAMGALVAVPEQASVFLKARLQSEKSLLTKHDIPRLIKMLDSEKFATREKASRALEDLGGRAEIALRIALANNPSLELRRRVERLLARIDQHQLLPEELRVVRCVEVLETIGSLEARRVLERLAAGAPEFRLAWEAKASLKRLRAGAPPAP